MDPNIILIYALNDFKVTCSNIYNILDIIDSFLIIININIFSIIKFQGMVVR